jgi:putative transposase
VGSCFSTGCRVAGIPQPQAVVVDDPGAPERPRQLREFNGEDDHVHLLVDHPPKAAIPAPVNSLKAASAQRLRSEATGQVNRHTMHGHFWSPSYLAASCGDAPPGIIRQYIEQQRRPVNATFGLTPP